MCKFVLFYSRNFVQHGSTAFWSLHSWFLAWCIKFSACKLVAFEGFLSPPVRGIWRVGSSEFRALNFQLSPVQETFIIIMQLWSYSTTKEKPCKHERKKNRPNHSQNFKGNVVPQRVFFMQSLYWARVCTLENFSICQLKIAKSW